jgi:hypothetical protein
MTTQTSTTDPLDRAAPPGDAPTYSTYWLPLDEPRQTWAAFGAQAELVPTLKATAHAFFALCHEVKALKHFDLAVEQEQRGLFAEHAGYWYGQAEHALFEATHHWSRAAYELDALSASDFPSLQDGLQEYRALSRAARHQQERLWKLTDEVRDALLAWRRRQEARIQASTAQASGQTDDNRGGQS